MLEPLKTWDIDLVRAWLSRRLDASKLDQAAADQKGYLAHDEYDKAAAEEWVCGALISGIWLKDPATLSKRIKDLLGRDAYAVTGLYDESRFDRHVRTGLRKIAKMLKTDDGFANVSRYQ